MRKVKLQLPTSEWQDLTTKYAPDDNLRVDQNAFTDGTKNIETESDGTIRKMKGGTQFYTLTTAAKDQYEVVFSDGTRHLLTVDDGDLYYTAGTPSATLVTAGYSSGANFEFATTQDRVYFGNGVVNQVYDKTTSYGGVAYSAPQTKTMGAQVPSTAPTATIVAGAGVPAGGHTYKVTYLYYDSEESNGSAASNLVTVVAGPNQQVDLSSVPIGGYGVTARKIYRDDNDGVYTLVGTISDNTTTTFSDNAVGGTTPIPTDNGIPPVFGQVELYLDRLWLAQVSGEPFTLYFTEAGLPDIVQSTNFLDCNPGDPITSLIVYRGRLIVFNRRSMGQILGSTKDSFRYDPINSTVGCVDNRSIQEIVLQGVPTLIWLSDKGFYGFNGSSIFYLSDNIEDLVNVNIKQAVIQKNEHVDTTNADFTAGTASDGIDIAGGAFSVRGYDDGTSTVANNPRRTWNDTADWDNGDSLDNISTIDQGNNLTIVPDNTQSPTVDGTRDNLEVDGASTRIPLSADFLGEDESTDADNFTLVTPEASFKVAWSFTPDRNGTLDDFQAEIFVSKGISLPSSYDYNVKVWADSGGSPGAEVSSGPTQTTTSSTIVDLAVNNISAGNPTLSGGTTYWVGVDIVDTGGINMIVVSKDVFDGGARKFFNTIDGWHTRAAAASTTTGLQLEYNFTSSAAAASGTWTSDIIDTQSTSADPVDYTITATYGSFGNSTTLIEGGDGLDFAGNIIVDETQSINDISGTEAITLGSRRYYQVKITLATTDDRFVTSLTSSGTFTFSGTAEWISDSIDTTGDSTVYNALTTSSTTPGSSTVVTEIRTAATEGGLTAAPWVAFGSVTVRKFAQIRLTLTKDGSNLPSVSSINFTWTVVANLISEAIDTTVTPSGWDIFTTDFTTNGGTVVFEMRSATTEGGLSGATWNTVTNGSFPPAALDVERWVQWRATITATDSNVPSVASITIRWFVGDTDSVRAASIFFNKNYYVALAEFGNDENNIILQLDARGKWRIKRGLGVSTFSYFFNEPYFGQSTAGVIGKFLDSLQDLGTDIEVDVRTRAFDYSSNFFDNSEFVKVPEGIIIEGRGTGATYDVSFSIDGGDTFTNMTDVVSGTTTFTTTNDDKLFSRVFRATDSSGAKTIIYRVHTNDEFDVKLHRLKATAFITQREPIITG